MSQLGFPLYMNGQEIREPVTLQHWPSAGIGEYFSESVSGLGQTMMPAYGIPAYQRPRSTFSKVTAMSPLLSGIGQVTEAVTEAAKEPSVKMSLAIVAGVVAVGLLVRGVSGYYVGKAIAPRGRESKYAWGGVAASILLGTLGLGIEAGIALSNK